MTQPVTPSVVKVSVEIVSNGFILVVQTNNQPNQPLMMQQYQEPNRQVYNNFADMVSALATLLGVTLPADSITSAINATTATNTTSTSAH